jgi:Ca-activated chloride channel homolog
MMQGIEFQHPEVLWGLLALPLVMAWYILRIRSRAPRLMVSTVEAVRPAGRSWRGAGRDMLFGLRFLALAAIIVALARPVKQNVESQVETEGIDIVIALDLSSSMLARDFKPDRLEAAKEVAIEFINSRPNDRIGLVVFSGEAFTQCPITLDHHILINLMRELKMGLIQDGTAIGSGLGIAVNRLRESAVKGKVVILLTDGVNNAGNTDPLTAAALASTFNIRVYTIGVGSQGKAYSPIGIYPDGRYAFDYVDVEIDEELLKQISAETGGQYFRATDKTSLQAIYREIDEMEKSRVRVSSLARNIDLFFWPALIALVLLVLELLLRPSLFRTIT